MKNLQSFTKCPYHDYYLNQAGTGVGTVYRGAYYQRGHGIGSFLKGLFRTIFPLIKSGVKTVGKQTLESGIKFIDDIAENKPVKKSFKERLNEAGHILQNKAENKIQRMVGSGRGIKRKMFNNKMHKVKNIREQNKVAKKKVKYSDIFN